MGLKNKKVTAKLPKGNKYTGTLCGYEFDHGVAKDVLKADVERFHWRIVLDEPVAPIEPEKPETDSGESTGESTKEPISLTLEELPDTDYQTLRKFYFAHKDDEGFPEPADMSEETLRSTIEEFIKPPEDPE